MGENLNKYGMKPLTKKNYFVYGLGNFASQLSAFSDNHHTDDFQIRIQWRCCALFHSLMRS